LFSILAYKQISVDSQNVPVNSAMICVLVYLCVFMKVHHEQLVLVHPVNTLYQGFGKPMKYFMSFFQLVYLSFPSMIIKKLAGN